MSQDTQISDVGQLETIAKDVKKTINVYFIKNKNVISVIQSAISEKESFCFSLCVFFTQNVIFQCKYPHLCHKNVLNEVIIKKTSKYQTLNMHKRARLNVANARIYLIIICDR